jgi:hypothetical protein
MQASKRLNPRNGIIKLKICIKTRKIDRIIIISKRLNIKKI